jgi:hypothetical protein
MKLVFIYCKKKRDNLNDEPRTPIHPTTTEEHLKIERTKKNEKNKKNRQTNAKRVELDTLPHKENTQTAEPQDWVFVPTIRRKWTAKKI